MLVSFFYLANKKFAKLALPKHTIYKKIRDFLIKTLIFLLFCSIF